ncbi:MAG: nitroreductase family protein [Chlamydiales bacterium]|nr:nitroreductase family protein [Chlamydiales bacterium]
MCCKANAAKNQLLNHFRYILAKRETEHWSRLFDLLVPSNQSWVKNAGALMILISHKIFDHNGKPSNTHSFDAGAAWENLALEGSAKGLVVHCMQGFDYAKAKSTCNIPDDYQVEALVAVGKPGPKEALDPDTQKREFPSGRKPLSELIFHGTFS